MRIYVDKQEQKIDLPSASSLGEIIDGICGQKISGDRVITHIRINGEQLLEDENGFYPDVPVKEIESLELQTGLSKEMVHRGLKDARDYLERLNPGIQQTAEMLRVREDMKALDQYGHCMDGLNWIVQILEGARQIIGLDYSKISLNRASV
jgi:hypothetical protein